ncbi:DNA internalization competence protein ComEC/Rec2-like protein [Clostridiales bacterium KA00134]|nr:DNA internalization competence protein ComEC/Rec2-like protein [Clostridiales bacterium KA00134]
MYFVASYIAGILTYNYFTKASLTVILALAFLVSSYFYFKSNKKKFLIYYILFLFGLVNFGIRTETPILGEHSIKAKVVKVLDKGFVLKVNKFPLSKKVLIKSYEDLDIEKGDFVSLSGDFEKAEDAYNFKSFSYKKYLLGQGILSICRKPKIEYIKRQGSFVGAMPLRIKNTLFGDYNRYMSTSSAEILEGLILSEKSSIENLNAYRQVGLGHILSISGFHIGILYLFLFGIFRFIDLDKKICKLMALILVIFYCWMIDFPPGALRACLMLIFTDLAFFVKGQYSTRDGLFISLFIILIFAPYQLFNISLLLSYFGVGGIIYLGNRLVNVYGGSYIKNDFLILLGVNISIFPIQALSFASYNIFSIPINLILTPLYSLAIIVAYIASLFSVISLPIRPLYECLDYYLRMCNFLVNGLNNYLNFSLNLRQLGILSIFAYVFLFLLISRLIKIPNLNRKIYTCIIIYFALLLGIYSLEAYRSYGALKLSFIYVGQGDACLINYRGKNFLVDTGGCEDENYNPGEIYLKKVLEREGVRTIDGVFISHFDADHVEGIKDIWDRFKIKRVFMHSYPTKSPYLKKIIKRGLKTISLKDGQVLKSDDLEFKVLYDGSKASNENASSLILMVNLNGFKILFTGDSDKESEKFYNGEETTILKVAHHGSNTSTSQEFLEKVRPKIAVISCGYKNSYGHPSELVLANLKNENVKTFVTAYDGEIKMTYRNGRLRIDRALPKNKISIYDYYKDFLIMLVLTSIAAFLVLDYRRRDELQRDL